MEFELLPDFLRWQPPKIEPIIDNELLFPGTKMIVYGPFGIGKSLLCNQIAFDIAGGGRMLNLFQCYPNFVWRIQLELPKALDHKRVVKYTNTNMSKAKIPKNIALSTESYLKLDTDVGIGILYSILEKHPEIKVMVLDPFWKLITGSISDTRDVGNFCDKMDMLVERTNVAVILVTHCRKKVISGRGDIIDLGAEEILGSVRLPGWADSILGMRPLAPDEVELNFNKVRHGEQLIPSVKLQLHRVMIKFVLL